jgi:hypothetical protein
MKRIASFDTDFEANCAKQYLEQQGIAAQIEGATSAATLSIASSAIGGAKLFVEVGNASRATAALSELRTASSTGDQDWWCRRCRVEVDAGFGCCWNCGQDRDVIGEKITDNLSANQSPTAIVNKGDESVFDGSLVPAGPASDNPYAAPLTLESAAVVAAKDPHIDFEAADELITRAWRASIVGLLLCPVLLHLYSGYLLILASRASSSFSPRSTRLFYVTAAVDLVAGCLGALVYQHWLTWML